MTSSKITEISSFEVILKEQSFIDTLLKVHLDFIIICYLKNNENNNKRIQQ